MFIKKLDYINSLRESQNSMSINQHDELRTIVDKMALDKMKLAEMYEERIREIRYQLNSQVESLTDTNQFNLEYIQSLQK